MRGAKVKKKRLATILGLALVLMITIFTSAHAQPTTKPQPINLRLAHYSPPGHPMLENIAVPWSKMLEEKTNGKVKVTIYPAQTLCKMEDTPDAVRSGLADIACGFPSASPGLFPVTDVIVLPFAPWNDTAEFSSQVEQTLYNKGWIADEWRDVKLLFFYTTPPSQIFTTKPIRTMEDLKGTRIRSYGGLQVKTAKVLGCVPITVTDPDVYMSLERRVIEGTTYTWEGCAGRKLHEVLNYALECNIYSVPFYYIMNLKKFNSLPPDVRDIIESISGMNAAKFAGKAFDANDQKAKKEVVAPALKEVIKLSPTEKKRWRKAVDQVWEDWIVETKGKGRPVREVVNAAIRIAEELK
jgi:TRAP-type C4-dicarboxylate transport system substrate-binding protein